MLYVEMLNEVCTFWFLVTCRSNVVDVAGANRCVETVCLGCALPTASMLEENEKLKEERTCKVCMDAEVNTVFLPCGHFICCAECAKNVQRCPICRVFIVGTVKASIS